MKNFALGTVLLLLIISTLAGCIPTLAKMRAQNRQNLLLLSQGMEKSEVIALMGTETVSEMGHTITNPYRSELYKADGHVYELLLYYTDIKKADGAVTDDELVPIVFMDGKVDGWGWSYWNNLTQKYELRIR